LHGDDDTQKAHKVIEGTAPVMRGVDLLLFALYRDKTRLALAKEMLK